MRPCICNLLRGTQRAFSTRLPPPPTQHDSSWQLQGWGVATGLQRPVNRTSNLITAHHKQLFEKTGFCVLGNVLDGDDRTNALAAYADVGASGDTNLLHGTAAAARLLTTLLLTDAAASACLALLGGNAPAAPLPAAGGCSVVLDLAPPRAITLRAAWAGASRGLDNTEHAVGSDAATLFCSCAASSGEVSVSANGHTSVLSHGSLLISSMAPSLVPDSSGISDAGAMMAVGRYELSDASDKVDVDSSGVSADARVVANDNGASCSKGVKFLHGGKLHAEAAELRKRFGMPISLAGHAAFSGRWGDAA